MKRTISNNSRLCFRSAAVTLFMFFCAFTAVWYMGSAYSAMQMTAFGNDLPAFFISDWDEFTLFGKSYHIPVMTAAQKVYDFLHSYSPGIVKLIGYALDGIEEGLNGILG